MDVALAGQAQSEADKNVSAPPVGKPLIIDKIRMGLSGADLSRRQLAALFKTSFAVVFLVDHYSRMPAIRNTYETTAAVDLCL